MLSNFEFGGSPAGLPTLVGGASGDLASGVTISDTGFLNSFTQPFAPGSLLRFTLALTTNLDSFFPDQFSFAIFHGPSQFEIPTQSFFSAFLTIDIDSANPLVQTFASDPAQSPGIALSAPATTAVPEPSTLLLLGGALTLRAAGRLLHR